MPCACIALQWTRRLCVPVTSCYPPRARHRAAVPSRGAAKGAKCWVTLGCQSLAGGACVCVCPRAFYAGGGWQWQRNSQSPTAARLCSAGVRRQVAAWRGPLHTMQCHPACPRGRWPGVKAGWGMQRVAVPKWWSPCDITTRAAYRFLLACTKVPDSTVPTLAWRPRGATVKLEGQCRVL